MVTVPLRFCRSGNRDSERRWDLPKVTQLACGAAETRTQDSRVAGVCRGSKKRLSQHKGPPGDLSATTDKFIHYFRGKGICGNYTCAWV